MKHEMAPTDEELIEFAQEFIYTPGIYGTKLYYEICPAASDGRLSKRRRIIIQKLMTIYNSIKVDSGLQDLYKQYDSLESKMSVLRNEFFERENELRKNQEIIRSSQAELIKTLLLVNGINLEE
jgi:hypothetical protein